jgi:flagellar biosynthesis/type III secretory pathway protein FliH
MSPGKKAGITNQDNHLKQVAAPSAKSHRPDVPSEKQALRQKAEAKLLEHRAHFEEMIQKRTAELVISKGCAEAANQAKSAFLATNYRHSL